MRIFGCPAYAHVNEEKLKARAKKCVFLGYGQGVKGYRLWCTDPASPMFMMSRDVTFDEVSMLRSTSASREKKESTENGDHGVEQQVEFQVETPSKFTSDLEGSVKEENSVEERESHVQYTTLQQQQDNIATSRPKRQIKPPQRYANVNLVDYALSVAESIGSEPTSFNEAVRSTEGSQWSVAMNEEMESLRKNHTWELIKLPASQRVVGCKWVFKKKEGISGVERTRFKA